MGPSRAVTTFTAEGFHVGVLCPKSMLCFGERGRFPSILGCRKTHSPAETLGVKAVTPSHFHSWVVHRQTAVHLNGKLSPLAFQVLSCKWITGGTTVPDCSPGLCVSEKKALCVILPPLSASPCKGRGTPSRRQQNTHTARVIAILRMYFIQNNQFIWK